MGLLFVFPSMDNVWAQEGEVPGWIKQVAGFWSDGQISDDEFLQAIKFLIQNDIIIISESVNDIVQTEPKMNATMELDIKPAKIEIVPPKTTISDILIAESNNNEDAVFGFESKMSLNHIWIVKKLYELGDEEKIDSISLFLESMMGEFRAGENYNKKVDRIKAFLNEDEDFESFWSDVSMDELIRYNNRHVDNELFFAGVVHEVTDLPGDDQYELLIYVDEINFDDQSGVVVAEYEGSRIRDGDNILVSGTVADLQIKTISNKELIVKIKSGSIQGNIDDEQENSDNASIQVEAPVITISHAQVLIDPYYMIPEELEGSALRISYNTLDENESILINSILYYEGTVTSVVENKDGLLQGFRLDVNPSSSDVDIITFLKDDETVNISRYDKIGVYGLVMQGSGGELLMHALHITS